MTRASQHSAISRKTTRSGSVRRWCEDVAHEVKAVIIWISTPFLRRLESFLRFSVHPTAATILEVRSWRGEMARRILPNEKVNSHPPSTKLDPRMATKHTKRNCT